MQKTAYHIMKKKINLNNEQKEIIKKNNNINKSKKNSKTNKH